MGYDKMFLNAGVETLDRVTIDAANYFVRILNAALGYKEGHIVFPRPNVTET